MYTSETVHRYPRTLIWSIEALCTIVVAISAINLGSVILRYAWSNFGLDQALFLRVPFLVAIVDWIQGPPGQRRIDELTELLPTLWWAAIALLLVILVRNALPTVRTNSQGLLVEFADEWLPIPWENLRAVKVTGDIAGERFVILVQTDRKKLTGWHRLYSLFYRLGWRPGFWVTSSISDFDNLVKTVLSESKRIAHLIDNVKPVQLDEGAPSPLFRFMLGPASFFSQAKATKNNSDNTLTLPDQAMYGEQSAAYAGPVQGVYPARITTLLTWSIIILAGLTVWQYLLYWARFLALELPLIRGVPPFSWVFAQAAYVELVNAYRTNPVPFFGVAGRPDLPQPWWLLISAHLLVLFMIGVLMTLRGLLPTLEARSEGLAVRNLMSNHWFVVPWSHFATFKATEFSEHSQVLLLQIRNAALPWHYRLNSLLYDGSFSRGIIVTSAMDNFQPLLQRALFEVTSIQAKRPPRPNDPPLLQQEARSWLLWLAFMTGAALDQLIEEARDDVKNRAIQTAPLLRAAGSMTWLALPLPLLLLLDMILLRGSVPGLGVFLGAIGLWLVSMLEWPLVSLVSVLLDETGGSGGEEGYRAVYLYPAAQLPRLLPWIALLTLLVAGVPLLLLVVLWIGALAWSFLLAAGLWEKLYGWKGSLSLLGGLLPVLWQLITLLILLLVQR
ncbi:MAG: hypothetical protein MI924_33695 [Chloroflexales bacterium]|nr:hypothetical protein [Chloroflexales bacterium]